LTTSPTGPEREIRAGVVGAGAFGRLHAQKYLSLPGVKLVGIADSHPARAQTLANDLGVAGFVGWRAMLPYVDVVTVAAPARVHGEVGVGCLNQGKHVLMEKPLATNLREADALVRLSEVRGLVLHVGHQERFVMRHLGLLDEGMQPLRIECHRAGPFAPRNTDVSVVLDLMIHDLDLVHQLNGASVTSVQASQRSLHSLSDEVSASLVFSDGMEAELFASRMADARRRVMRLVYPDGEIYIDFLSRQITNTTARTLRPFAANGGESDMPTPASDPLGYSVAQFVHAVREDMPAAISPREARQALATALSILDAAKASRPQQRAAHA